MAVMTFVAPDGTSRRVVDVEAGQTILEVARVHDIEIEGLCGGSLACATCHVIVETTWAERLVPPEPDEQDMLELAPGLQPTSRLGCQVTVTEALDGLVVTLPETDIP